MTATDIIHRPSRFAWPLLAAAACLAIVSLAFVHSSTLGDSGTTAKQAVWFAAGLVRIQAAPGIRHSYIQRVIGKFLARPRDFFLPPVGEGAG